MKDPRLQDFLKREPLFASLKQDTLDLLEEHLVLVQFPKGHVLCREGELGDRLYVVARGTIGVTKKGGEDSEVEIATLEAGELAGMMSLLRADPRSATMTAATDLELWELDRDTFSHLLEDHPEFARQMISELSKYLRVQTARLADLTYTSQDKRFKMAVFDSKPYMEQILKQQNQGRFSLHFFEPKLSPDTVSLAAGYQAVCVFVNDVLNEEVIISLKQLGVELIVLRCAGFNHVNLEACRAYGLTVVRVPAYSPYAVAEHSIALMMALNRHTHQAYNRIRDGNFSLNNLVGFDMYKKTVGVIGSGKIGKCAIDILLGFGCRVMIYNRSRDPALEARGVVYATLDEIYAQSDIITIYIPLTSETHHLINEGAIKKMKRGVMLINTSRGGLIDTNALIKGLVEGKIGSAGLDVYEEESRYFFEDFSAGIISDDTLARLMTFNNVLITSHMAFLTKEALTNIADTTLDNVEAFEKGLRGSQLENLVALGDNS